MEFVLVNVAGVAIAFLLGHFVLVIRERRRAPGRRSTELTLKNENGPTTSKRVT